MKVAILYFNGNLNIEDFIDWLANIDKFFDYMEILEEKQVRLVSCRLKERCFYLLGKNMDSEYPRRETTSQNMVQDEETVKERFSSPIL